MYFFPLVFCGEDKHSVEGNSSLRLERAQPKWNKDWLSVKKDLMMYKKLLLWQCPFKEKYSWKSPGCTPLSSRELSAGWGALACPQQLTPLACLRHGEAASGCRVAAAAAWPVACWGHFLHKWQAEWFLLLLNFFWSLLVGGCGRKP